MWDGKTSSAYPCLNKKKSTKKALQIEKKTNFAQTKKFTMDKTFEVGYYYDTFKHKYDIQTV